MTILAGGENARLAPLNGTLYKPFLPVAGLTMISRHLARAALAGIAEVTIVTDHHDPLVAAYIDHASSGEEGYAIEWIRHQGSPESKILAAAECDSAGPPMVVVLGDSFALYDPRDLHAAASAEGNDSAIAIAPYRLPFGVVEASGGRISSFREKPKTPYLVNTGQLALGAAAIGRLDAGEHLAAVLAAQAAEGSLAAIELASALVTVDSLFDLAALAGGLTAEPEPQSEVHA